MSRPQNSQVTTVNVLPDLGPCGFSGIMLTGLPLWPLRSPPSPGFSLYPRKNGHSELLPHFLPGQAMAPAKTRPKGATLATGRASSKGLQANFSGRREANTEHFTLSTAPQGMEDFLALGEKAPVWAPSWWSPWALVPKPGATPTYAEAGGLNDHGSPIRAGPRNRSFQQPVPSRECWRAHPVMTQLYKMFLQ